jgi:hypothetical protein
MDDDSLANERIGPQIDLDEIPLDEGVAERFGRLYGSDEPPQTAAGWVDQMRASVAAVRDRDPTVADLCTAPDGDHAFHGEGGEQSYICVLDPLVYPFLTGETGTVRSRTPVRGERVEFAVRPDGIDVSHDSAVVSLGVSDQVADIDEVTLDVVYRQVCGYIHPFVDRAEYETWAADVEATTMALSAAEGVTGARGIARVLFESDRSPGRPA